MIETINTVNKEVAKTFEIDESLVKEVNSFYWKKLREAISSCNYTSIWIRGIGTLTISRFKLNCRIEKTINEIRYFQNSGDREFKKKKKDEYIEEKKQVLTKLLERRNDVAQVYREKEIQIKNKKTTNGTESAYSNLEK